MGNLHSSCGCVLKMSLSCVYIYLFGVCIFTDPLEIVKFKLEVAGEMTQVTRTSAIGVIKELGFGGLRIQGVCMCMYV